MRTATPARTVRTLAAAGLVAVGLASGCSMQERICGSDQYPAKAVGNTSGMTCVPKDQQPPSNYVRYPDGKVPTYVGDEWDTYWKNVVVDNFGNIVQDASKTPGPSSGGLPTPTS